MAISYVGGVEGGRAGSTSTTTQSLSGTLTGGSDSSPSAGDLVVVFCAVGDDSTTTPSSLTISGNNNGAYTALAFQVNIDVTYESTSQVSYKIQGGTVDTSLTIPSSANARNAQRWIVHVFRGVDSTTPLDVTSTYADGSGTGRPDPAAITPSRTGAWICAFYASAAATGAAYTAPTDFATNWLGNTQADTADVMTGGGYYTGWTSGSYNPAAISAGGTTGANNSWTATTIALRPYNVSPTVALNSPSDTATGVSTTPALQFTGTDSESDDITYEVQVDTVNTFGGVVDSYSETNFSQSFGINSTVGTSTYMQAQSFTGDGSKLGNAQFYISASGSPTGTLYYKVYAETHSTAFGTDSVPTGSALATSDGINLTTVPGSKTLVSDNFSGVNQITLSNGTNYVISCEISGGDGSNSISVGVDNTSPTHSGNKSSATNNTPTTYTPDSSRDVCFYINSAPLIDATSASGGHDAAQFSGSPDNTDPYTSGQAVTFTVPSGETLSASTTYYWRVRGKDPSGSNTFGAWATTRSFTTAGGGGGGPGPAQPQLTGYLPLMGVGG